MRHWLLENIEWFALGLGILLVTIIIGVIARIIMRRWEPPPVATPAIVIPPPAVEPPPAPRVTPTGRKRPESVMVLPSQPRSDLAVLALQGTRPKLQEILSKLRHTPAHQRDILIDSFFGFPVTCVGVIKSAVKLSTGKILIDLTGEGEFEEDVFFEVYPAEYPRIDLKTPGTRIVANGRFRCSASVIWLDDVELAA